MSLILDELEEIVFVSSIENYDILYLNNAGLNAFGLKKLKPGSKCYEVIYDRTAPCPNCTNSKLSLTKSCKRSVYNIKTNRTYYIKDKLIQWNDGKICKMEVADDLTEQLLARKEIEETEKIEATIIRCLKTLHEKGDLTYNLNLLLAEIGRFLQAKRAYIYKCDYDSQILENTNLWVAKNNKENYDIHNKVKMEYLKPWMRDLENDKHIYFDSSITYPKMQQIDELAELNIHRMFVAPIISTDKKLYGIFCIENAEVTISEKHLEMLFKTIAYFLISRIDRSRINDHLVYSSYHDSLTGLQNRNKFNIDFEKINRNKHTSVGIVYVDMNGLKVVNQNEGHIAGDNVLIQIANYLYVTFNPDYIYRTGSDEFSIICPDISQMEFMTAITKLQAFVADPSTPEIAMGFEWYDKINDLQQQLKHVYALMMEDKNLFYRKRRES